MEKTTMSREKKRVEMLGLHNVSFEWCGVVFNPSASEAQLTYPIR